MAPEAGETPVTTTHQKNINEPAENSTTASCPISSISKQLSEQELHPIAGSRHMVTPPNGGKVSLVCCSTTKGHLSVLIHEKWAPIGVARFLEMIESNYFESQIALYRCTDACQFGFAGTPELTRQFDQNLKDDLMWLPPGPDHRQNDKGVRRYPRGMLTYAGGGKNTRSNQFVLTLQPNKFMGGGSPWEVPIGELVGTASFETLSKLYNGYGEKGPSQPLLRKIGGNAPEIRARWPKLDYITSCHLVEDMTLLS